MMARRLPNYPASPDSQNLEGRKGFITAFHELPKPNPKARKGPKTRKPLNPKILKP